MMYVTAHCQLIESLLNKFYNYLFGDKELLARQVGGGGQMAGKVVEGGSGPDSLI